MAEMKVDCTGQTCPVPLVETRRALKKAKEGDIVLEHFRHPRNVGKIENADSKVKVDFIE